MASNRNLSSPGILAALLLPLLAGFAPAASADIPYYERPKIGLKGGPPITEGEPITFTLRITPVQAKDFVVPVLVYQLGTFDITIPANKREIVGSVPTVDNDVHESDRWYQVIPQIGPSQGTRTDIPYGAYARVLVKDNDSGSRPVVSIESQAQVLAESEGEWNWIMEGDIANFTIKTDETIKVNDTGVAREAFTACVSVRDSHTGRGGDFLAPQHEGNQCVTLPAGESSVTLSLPTVDDDSAESWDYIVVDLLDGSGYLRQQASPLYVKVFDNDSACPATWPYLIHQVRGHYQANRNRADRGYGRNWLRVLRAYGTPNYYAVPDYATLKPFTAAEARAKEAVWSGWAQVRQELERIETCARHGGVAGRHYPLTAPAVPEITLSGGSPVTEGGDATFTLTATPAPAAGLAVSVTVTATGDYGVTTGDRTVTIPATGSAALTVATEDDSADEPDGSLAATLNAGDGYTVGAPSSVSADILDDDDPVESQSPSSPAPACAATSAELVKTVRGYYELNRGRAERNHGENWLRALIAFGAETHATLEPLTAVEARSGEAIWSGWAPVREELERLETCASASIAVESQSPSFPATACAATSAELAKTVRGYYELNRGRADRNHGENWLRALIAFGAETHATLEPLTAVEARSGEAIWSGWAPVREELERLETCASVAVSNNDMAPLAVSVDDATVSEGREASFAVRLSAPAPSMVIVYAQTRETIPVSAKEDVDYQRRQLSVAVFRPGDTVQSITVPTTHDAHDDGGETFELVLTRATAARRDAPFKVVIEDAVATGTIANDDPLPAAYLARFGRAVAEQALDGIAGRIDAERSPGMRGRIAGHALGFGSGMGAGADAGSAAACGMSAAMPGAAHGFGAQASRSGGVGIGCGGPVGRPMAARSGALGLRDILAGSSFALTGGRDASGGSVAFWGSASHSRFEGREDSLSLAGEVSTGLLGADYARGGWLAGLALARSASEGGYRDAGIAPLPGGLSAGAGGVEATLTAAVPYASARLSERLRIWGAAGLGGGDVRLRTEAGEDISAGTRWRMASAGLRGELLSGGGGAGLSLVSDALWTATDSEPVRGLSASEGAASRARAGLEGRYRFDLGRAFGGGPLSGASLTPSLEVAARHDGGDAETGFGVDVGGGLAFSAPSLGLALEVRGRALVAHADGAARRSGFSASLAWDPRPASALGWSLSLRQDAGGPSGGGIDALFSGGPFAAAGIGPAGAPALGASRWTAEAGYGVSAFGGRFVGAPRLGYGRSPFSRDYSVGWRLSPSPEAANAPDLSLGFSATRREADAVGAEHGIGLDIALRW